MKTENRFSELARESDEASGVRGPPKQVVAFDCETNTELPIRTDDPAWEYAGENKRAKSFLKAIVPPAVTNKQKKHGVPSSVVYRKKGCSESATRTLPLAPDKDDPTPAAARTVLAENSLRDILAEERPHAQFDAVEASLSRIGIDDFGRSLPAIVPDSDWSANSSFSDSMVQSKTEGMARYSQRYPELTAAELEGIMDESVLRKEHGETLVNNRLVLQVALKAFQDARPLASGISRADDIGR